MDKDVLIAVIGIGGTLFGVIIGFFLQLFYSNYQNKNNIINEFEKVQVKVLSHNLINDFLILKKQIKDFIVDYPKILRQPEIKEFWNKWIANDSMVDHPISAVGFSSQEFDEMKNDLS